MRRGRPPYPDTLTPREREVLALLREGLTNEQIAERLGISFAGAKYHVSEILSKLYVTSRAEAAVWRPRERVFGLGILAVSLKKLSPEEIMRLSAKALLATGVTLIVTIAIGAGIMALRHDSASTPSANGDVAQAPNTQPQASRATPFTSFEGFDKVRSYRAVIRYEQGPGPHRPTPQAPVDAVAEVEGKNIHAFLTLPDLGEVEFIKVNGEEYTRVRGAWTTDAVPGVDYITLRHADVKVALNEVRENSFTEGKTDTVGGSPCQIVIGNRLGQGEGGVRYALCYSGDMPLRIVQQEFANTLTITLSAFNESFSIQAPE